MKSLTEKNMREARRRLALSRKYADPVMRAQLDRISIEAATKEYIRRDEAGAQAEDLLLNQIGVTFRLGERAYFCPTCKMVMQRCAYDDAFECLWCHVVRRRRIVLDTCESGFPDIIGHLIKAKPLPALTLWRRAVAYWWPWSDSWLGKDWAKVRRFWNR